MACSQGGGDIKDMYLRVKNPDMEPVFKQDDEAWHAMRCIAKLRKAIGASESGVNFGYDEDRCADIDVAERIFGRFVNVALQNSFEVCAKFKKWQSSVFFAGRSRTLSTAWLYSGRNGGGIGNAVASPGSAYGKAAGVV